MNKTLRFLSYVMVAVLASVISFGIALGFPPSEGGPSKLEQLENLIQARFIGDVNTAAIEDAAAAAMVEALGDRWSHYMSAEEYNKYKEQMNNSYVGVGITIQAGEDGEGFNIVQVEPSGPAFEAGIRPGDVLVGTAEIRFEGMQISDAGTYVKGEKGTTVDLLIWRDHKELIFTVERRQVQIQVAKGQMLENNIGLVTIVNFDARCAQETLAQIESLLDQGAQALIFDVRNNPGGFKDEMVQILDYLLPKGPLFRSELYNGKISVDESNADCLDLPMAVLVNGDSYSAAEFFAAALAEYEAAVVVGSPTTGKGYFQNTFELRDGSALTISVGKYTTPNGVNLADVGIIPDIEVKVDEEMELLIYSGLLDPSQDPQIQAAAEVLR